MSLKLGEEESKHYLAWLPVVRNFYMKKHNINRQDLEILFMLQAMKYFSREEFYHCCAIFTWNKLRFKSFVDKGYVTCFRKRTNKQKSVWKLTPKCTGMLNSIYNVLNGKIQLSEKGDKGNPFRMKDGYADKMNMWYILKFKEYIENERFK